MMQELLVALIVAVAAWTVARRYAPKALRSRVRAAAANVARRAGFDGFAERLLAAPAASSSSCADGCGTCGGCPTDSPSTSTSSSAKSAVHGISVDQLRRTIPR